MWKSCKIKLVREKCDFVLSFFLFYYYFSRDDTEKSLKMGQRQQRELSAAAYHCQTSSIITDANSDPISPSITQSPTVLSQHIIFLLICTFITPYLCRLIRKEETVTETQKIHLLHIPQEWPSAHRTQLRQNSSSALKIPYHWEILSCCSSGSHTHRNIRTIWWLGFWELDYQMTKSGDAGKVLRFVKWTPRKTKT